MDEHNKTKYKGICFRQMVVPWGPALLLPIVALYSEGEIIKTLQHTSHRLKFNLRPGEGWEGSQHANEGTDGQLLPVRT